MDAMTAAALVAQAANRAADRELQIGEIRSAWAAYTLGRYDDAAQIASRIIRTLTRDTDSWQCERGEESMP